MQPPRSECRGCARVADTSTDPGSSSKHTGKLSKYDPATRTATYTITGTGGQGEALVGEAVLDFNANSWTISIGPADKPPIVIPCAIIMLDP